MSEGLRSGIGRPLSARLFFRARQDLSGLRSGNDSGQVGVFSGIGSGARSFFALALGAPLLLVLELLSAHLFFAAFFQILPPAFSLKSRRAG